MIGGEQVWDVATGKLALGARSFSGTAIRPLKDVLTASGEAGASTTRAFVRWLDDARTGIEIRREGLNITLERWGPEPSAYATIAIFAAPPTPTAAYALSPNGHFFVASLNGQLRGWSLLDGSVQHLKTPPIDWRGKDIALSNDGTSLAFWTRRMKNLPLFTPGPLRLICGSATIASRG